MALAPKQKEMVQQRWSTEGQARPQTDSAALAVAVTMRNVMAKVMWESNKRIMNVAELCVTDERIWKIARSQMLDEFNQAEKTYKQLINALLVGNPGEEEQNGATTGY